MEHTKAYQEFKKNGNTKFVRYSEGAEMYHMGMQAVDISFLSEDAQQWVLVAIQDTNAVITKQQSAMLKESDKKGELTFPMVRMLLEKEKPVERKVVIKTERINSYFPDTYSTDDIEKIIFQLLDNWKNTQ